jgi:hypothetical protein
MPIFGELELGTIAEELPRLRDLDTEAWELPKAEIYKYRARSRTAAARCCRGRCTRRFPNTSRSS